VSLDWRAVGGRKNRGGNGECHVCRSILPPVRKPEFGESSTLAESTQQRYWDTMEIQRFCRVVEVLDIEKDGRKDVRVVGKVAEKPAAPNQTTRKNRRYILGMNRESVTTLRVGKPNSQPAREPADAALPERRTPKRSKGKLRVGAVFCGEQPIEMQTAIIDQFDHLPNG